MSGNKIPKSLSSYVHDEDAQTKYDVRYRRVKYFIWIYSCLCFSLLIYLTVNRHDSLHLVTALALLVGVVLIATFLGVKFCEGVWGDCSSGCVRRKSLFDPEGGKTSIPSDGEHCGFDVQRIAMICECKKRFVWMKQIGQKFHDSKADQL